MHSTDELKRQAKQVSDKLAEHRAQVSSLEVRFHELTREIAQRESGLTRGDRVKVHHGSKIRDAVYIEHASSNQIVIRTLKNDGTLGLERTYGAPLVTKTEGRWPTEV